MEEGRESSFTLFPSTGWARNLHGLCALALTLIAIAGIIVVWTWPAPLPAIHNDRLFELAALVVGVLIPAGCAGLCHEMLMNGTQGGDMGLVGGVAGMIAFLVHGFVLVYCVILGIIIVISLITGGPVTGVDWA